MVHRPTIGSQFYMQLTSQEKDQAMPFALYCGVAKWIFQSTVVANLFVVLHACMRFAFDYIAGCHKDAFAIWSLEYCNN